MTSWTREMAVELAREQYERGRAEMAAEVERLRRELAIARINPKDHILSRTWSAGCREREHVACPYEATNCDCPCHQMTSDPTGLLAG